MTGSVIAGPGGGQPAPPAATQRGQSGPPGGVTDAASPAPIA